MISTATILACIVTLFVSLVLPVLILIVYTAKNKGKGILSAWLLGTAGFFVPQILIRAPILNMLAASGRFLAFAQAHPILYYLLLAFTAGLFELAGRFTVARLLGRNRTFQRSLAAGLGHGGIEAILIVGLTYLNNLVYIFLIQTGGFDSLVAGAAASGVDVTQLEAIRYAFLQTSSVVFLLAGLERLLTMAAQAAMSVIVCYAVHTRHTIPGLLICLGMHTLLDTSTIIATLSTETMGNVLSQTTAYTILYVFLAVIALASLLFLKTIRDRWDAAPTGGSL